MEVLVAQKIGAFCAVYFLFSCHSGYISVQIIKALRAEVFNKLENRTTGHRLVFLLHEYVLTTWSNMSTPPFVELRYAIICRIIFDLPKYCCYGEEC